MGNFEKLFQVLNSTSGGHLHRQPTLGGLACSGRGPRLPGLVPQDKILLRGKELVFGAISVTSGCVKFFFSRVIFQEIS